MPHFIKTGIVVVALMGSMVACSAAPNAPLPTTTSLLATIAPTNTLLPPTNTSAPPTATSMPTEISTATETPAPSPTLIPTETATAEPTPPQADDNASIEIPALVAQMQDAVIARDQATYLSYVDLSDPTFALEHTHWADQWATESIVRKFELSVDNIGREGDTATADLHLTWRVSTFGEERTADFPVIFHLQDNGHWLYAGERWVTYETDHFIVHAAPGQEAFAENLITALPAIYEEVTTNLAYQPATRQSLKLYDSSEDVVATTLLGLSDITGWNEPGESLKLFDRETRTPESTVAHEFTHFVTFDMAGTTHGLAPWWLMEGTPEYVSSVFWVEGQAEDTLAKVVDWNANNNLVPWAAISDFDNVQTNRWRDLYAQGYAFVRFITETYGQEARNAWLMAMATDQTIDTATPAVLGVTFEEADAGFRAWLEQQE